MRCDFRTRSGNSHLLRNECVALIRKGWTNVKDFLTPSLGLGACSFLRRGIAQEYLRWGYPPWFHFVTGSLELTTAGSSGNLSA